jgi:lipoate-protein ligase A
VIGSSQPGGDVDYEAAGSARVPVVRRRTGGGAVLVVPGELAWLELTIDPSDPLWEPDVSRSSLWLGRAWAKALESIGTTGVEVHAGPIVRSPWYRRVCFGGLVQGEVTVGGRKVVGISQRRTREEAVFQCAALVRWDPASLLRLLSLPGQERRTASSVLAGLAAGAGVEAARLEQALLGALP